MNDRTFLLAPLEKKLSISGIMDETEELERERKKIEREKAALLKSTGAAINLPTPVPLRATSSKKKEERKEISMKVNSKDSKVIESKKWEVEDDEDEEDEMNEALNNVRSAVDRPAKVQSSRYHRHYRN